MNFRTVGAKLLFISLATIILMSASFIALMINGSRQISRQLSRQHLELAIYPTHSAMRQIEEDSLAIATQLANSAAVATSVQTNLC
ncbi:MAG: hypothetical protein FWC70_10930 [Defluviitaleaceae bacterium]|nr:hypothetical protein [Defluviitaleaceae bacterium]